jgi:AAA15 family ATPase/GTPase
MKKINIQLNQDYKAFRSGFKQELEGNLIIISGVNGGGKTQLVDIMSMSSVIPKVAQPHNRAQYLIDSAISIEGAQLSSTDIFRRSFKDNVDIANISNANPRNIHWNKDQAWKYFSNWNTWRSDALFSKSRAAISLLLAEAGKPTEPTYDQSKPNGTNTHITEAEFLALIPDTFVWEQDDLFDNHISTLFLDFAAKRHDEKARLGEGAGGFNNSEYIKNAPWTKLNNLFEKLKFDFRFKTDYEYQSPNIVGKIAIFPILNGVIDKTDPRELSELSDGEKSIISLTFASLNEENRSVEKLLLLDEFDNTLNPSLIEAFYIVLDEFFIKKGVVVVIVTHSPATISLAPKDARFYEICKQTGSSPIIVPIQADAYSELRVANKEHYDQIGALNNQLQALTDANKNNSKLLVVSEGKNFEHIKKAVTLLRPELGKKIKYLEGLSGKTGDTQLTTMYEYELCKQTNPVLFVWDCDSKKRVEGATAESGIIYKFALNHNPNNTKVKKGIENLYPEEVFTDDLYPEKETADEYGAKKIVQEFDKNAFILKIKADADLVHFSNFQPLIDKLEEITTTQITIAERNPNA